MEFPTKHVSHPRHWVLWALSLFILVTGAWADTPNIFGHGLGHGACSVTGSGEVICSQCDPGWSGTTCQTCDDPSVCGDWPPRDYATAAVTRFSKKTVPEWTEGVFPETVPYRSVTVLPPVDNGAELETDERKGFDSRWAVILKSGLQSDRHGRWVDLADGGRVWTASLVSPGAVSVSVIFDRLALSTGSQLWVYSKQSVYGPITAEHLSGDDGTSTPPLWGDHVVIELYEPDNGRSHVGALDLAHGYREFHNGGDCQVDVMCYNGGENQANSVAMILKHGYWASFWCSAAMINNPSGNPYVLTAEHCLFEFPEDYWDYLLAPDEDPSNQFFFNMSVTDPTFVFQYRNQSCEAPGSDDSVDDTIWSALSYNGDVDVIHHDHETDTALLSMHEAPSPQCVTYAGYDAHGNIPVYTAGISHPDGKPAKLSIDWDPPVVIDMDDDDPDIAANYQEDDTIWKVNLEVGFIEGGSSGSPLFDHTGRIIGALSGHIQPNPGYCTSGIDWVYGRLNRAFDLSTDLASAFSHDRKMDDAGSTVSVPVPLQKFGAFDACAGMANTYGIDSKVAEHFDVEWELLSDHGQIVGPDNDRTVQVNLDWIATEVTLRVTIHSTDPSCDYEHSAIVSYPAYGCEGAP